MKVKIRLSAEVVYHKHPAQYVPDSIWEGELVGRDCMVDCLVVSVNDQNFGVGYECEIIDDAADVTAPGTSP